MQNSINFGTKFSSQNILTQQFNYLEKVLVIHLFQFNTPDYSDTHISQTNSYNTLRIGLHDKLLNLTTLSTPSWFADSFITLFDYPCYILTQCGIYFSSYFMLFLCKPS